MVRIDDDVIRLTSRVQTNETDINTNRQNIADNDADINRLTGEVNDNETAIESNRQSTARSISRNHPPDRRTTPISARNRRSITTQGNAISALQNTPPPPPPPPRLLSLVVSREEHPTRVGI